MPTGVNGGTPLEREKLVSTKIKNRKKKGKTSSSEKELIFIARKKGECSPGKLLPLCKKTQQESGALLKRKKDPLTPTKENNSDLIVHGRLVPYTLLRAPFPKKLGKKKKHEKGPGGKSPEEKGGTRMYSWGNLFFSKKDEQ